MAAKKRAALLFVLLTLLVSSAAVASIPRSDLLARPSIDRYATDEEIDQISIDNARLLHRALARALPPSAPVHRLSESRVWDFSAEITLVRRVERPLSRSLRQGWDRAWPELAANRTVLSPDPLGYRDSSNLYAFCGGNPVGCRDPEGLAGYFFDGTWNDDRMKNVTNVVKLRNIYREKVEYLPGVGTTSMTKYPGGGLGAGGQNRLEDMYQLLIANYNAGDRNIDIFGFSRGAALSIAFANLIRERGIPDLSSARKVHVDRGDRGGWKKEVVYDRYFRPEIRFLGIFDTVGSFGWPGNELNAGYDLSRPTNVKTIRHATAQNEHCHFFPLTSMLDSRGRAPGDVVERAFRGAHADVGGGYDDNDELSRVPLGWMWEQALQAGVPLAYLPENQRTATPNLIEHDESSWVDHLLNKVKGGRSIYRPRQ